MKKYKSTLDFVLLAGLGIISFLTIAPKALVMPSSFQMLLLALVLGLLSAFLALLWREQPADEREAHNQAFASRMAYSVGSVVLITALLVQSLQHNLDVAIPIALLATIATKVLVQRGKDR